MLPLVIILKILRKLRVLIAFRFDKNKITISSCQIDDYMY
jgi:hypothetical protein